MPQYPLCLSDTYDTNYLFNCRQVPTQCNIISLWEKTLETAEVIQEWESRLAFLEDLGMATQDVLRGGATTTIQTTKDREL